MKFFSYVLLILPALCRAEGNADDPNAQLLAACMSDRGIDNVEDVKAALSKGADINVKDERSEQSALMAAVLRGKDSIVKYLIAAGADITIAERGGYTPPHGAAFQGRATVMQMLIDHGLDVNPKHEDEFVPFHRACWGREERHTEVVKMLLEHGIDPDIPGKDGKTCLDMTENEGTKTLIHEWKNERGEMGL